MTRANASINKNKVIAKMIKQKSRGINNETMTHEMATAIGEIRSPYTNTPKRAR